MTWATKFFDMPYHKEFMHKDDDALDAITNTILQFSPNFKSLLDFCCGAGQFVQRLAADGFDVSGIELSEEYARHCIENGLDVIYGDASTVKLDRQFDIVTCWNTSLGYTSRSTDIDILKNMVDHTVDGGHIFIEMSNSLDILRNFQPEIEYVKNRKTIKRKSEIDSVRRMKQWWTIDSNTIYTERCLYMPDELATMLGEAGAHGLGMFIIPEDPSKEDIKSLSKDPFCKRVLIVGKK